MQSQMGLVVYGGEGGSIVDKETGRTTVWAAVHIAHSFDTKDGVGMKTQRVKCEPALLEALRRPGVKFPLEGMFNVELQQRAIEGRGLMMDMKIMSQVQQQKAA